MRLSISLLVISREKVERSRSICLVKGQVVVALIAVRIAIKYRMFVSLYIVFALSPNVKCQVALASLLSFTFAPLY